MISLSHKLKKSKKKYCFLILLCIFTHALLHKQLKQTKKIMTTFEKIENHLQANEEITMLIENMISNEDEMHAMNKIINAIGTKKITQHNFYRHVSFWQDKCLSNRKFSNQ